MADSKEVIVGNFKHRKRFNLKRNKRTLVIVVLALLLLIPLSIRVVQYYLRDRKEQITPSTVAEPSLGPEAYVSSQKEAITKSDVNEAQKIEQRTAAANYFTNTYDFQRVLSELDLVKNDYPAASDNYFYLVSYFTALYELNRTDGIKEYAKKITALEDKGAKLIAPLPEAIRKAIDDNAR